MGHGIQPVSGGIVIGVRNDGSNLARRSGTMIDNGSQRRMTVVKDCRIRNCKDKRGGISASGKSSTQTLKGALVSMGP